MFFSSRGGTFVRLQFRGRQNQTIMKTPRFFLALPILAVLAPALSSCESLFPSMGKGELLLRFSASGQTRASGLSVPDTNDFILTVLSADGTPVYEGPYGLSPETIEVSAGEYSVKAVSCTFERPEFGTPQYGDARSVIVESGKRSYVDLVCHQINSGIKLNIAENFLTSFPNGTLFLKSDDGKLMYGYSEKRIAYFRPGEVALVLSDGAEDRELFVRRLESREILSVNISAPSPVSSSIPVSIQLDTTRYWSFEDYSIGDGEGLQLPDSGVCNIQQAKAMVGSKGVWVRGYVVGGDLSSSKVSFEEPFSSRTNIAIASRASVTEKSSCMSVQLQKGDIRDALNLVDNPDILGREVFIRGDIVQAYYGIPGIQNITEYRLK